jgi:hypothetical protein
LKIEKELEKQAASSQKLLVDEEILKSHARTLLQGHYELWRCSAGIKCQCVCIVEAASRISIVCYSSSGVASGSGLVQFIGAARMLIGWPYTL